MKASIKYLICLALSVLMSLTITAKAGTPEEDIEDVLREYVDTFSDICPLDLGNGNTLVCVELDEKAKSVIMSYLFSSPTFSAEILASMDEEARDTLITSFAENDSYAMFLYLIKNSGYRLVIKAYDSDIKVRSIVIPNYDIPVTDISHAPGFNEEEYSDLEMLHLFADTMNEECPYDTDGLKLDEVTVNDKEKWFVFYYVLDNSKTFEIIRDNKEDMKNAFIESFKNDPDMDQLFSLCRNTGYSICLRFLDPFRNATRIVISPSEL